MTKHWIAATVLSSVLIVGCGERGDQNAENAPETGTPADSATISPAPEDSRADDPAASPGADNSESRADLSDTRPAPTARSTSRPAPAPRADNDSRASAAERPSAPPAPRGPEYREVTVPGGTALPLELITALSSETAKVETPVRARLRQAVTVDGVTVLPAGATFSGHVTDVSDAGRVQGRARLAFRFTEVETAEGREDLRTNPLTFEAEASKGEDATKIGAGAVGGAIIGGLLGGGSGAAKGAAIGGAAGTGVVLATKGKQVNLAAGADLAATLADDYSVRVPVRR